MGRRVAIRGGGAEPVGVAGRNARPRGRGLSCANRAGNILSPLARVAELADAQDSGSCPGNWVEVQVLSRAFAGHGHCVTGTSWIWRMSQAAALAMVFGCTRSVWSPVSPIVTRPTVRWRNA